MSVVWPQQGPGKARPVNGFGGSRASVAWEYCELTSSVMLVLCAPGILPVINTGCIAFSVCHRCSHRNSEIVAV